MHATLLKAAPDLRIIDLAHDCPPGEVGAAAYLLRHSLPHCPPDTVCVVVVDPDVGSERSVIAARTDDHVFVGPDNGALSSVLADAEVRRVENRLLMGEWISATFHGRDIMAPVAAHLATG
ncbi:MAG: SAM-dependent chlorinase/fluorinase, partial [Planctomycetota bacterium]